MGFSSSDEWFRAMLESLTVERIPAAHERFGRTLQEAWGQVPIYMREDKSLRQNTLSHLVLYEGLVAAESLLVRQICLETLLSRHSIICVQI